LSARYFESLNAEALASLESMEGLDTLAPARGVVQVLPTSRVTPPLWYGYLAATIVAGAALVLHQFYKPLSAAILAILLGAALRNLSLIPAAVMDGCKGLVKRVIPITIVLTGATLNLGDAARGLPYFAVVFTAIAAGTAAALVVGSLLSASRKTSILLGAGTSICGTSAIVSVAPVIRAADQDLLLSVSTINILGLGIMLGLPFLGQLVGMSPQAFGVWAGSTVHAVPQAVATGLTFGPESGTIATLVKLMRVSLLAPFVLVVAALQRDKNEESGKVRYLGLLPPFLWGFAILALLNTLGLLPTVTFHPVGSTGPVTAETAQSLADAGSLLLTLSMAAMGLEVNLRQLIRSGGPALLTGLAASVLQCLATLLVIRWLI
jgi:uncharacterized integral membrane protein (TIGR00698 family)